MSDIPEEFLCPITKQVMVHPFITKAGYSYEYAAIANWLEKKKTDPMTNLTLEDTTISPNNTLRSIICAWHEEHNVEMPTAEKPPVSAYNNGKQFKPHPDLDKVLTYAGKTARKDEKKKLKFGVPESFSVYNHKYSFTRKQHPSTKRSELYVQCDNGQAIKMPKEGMFVTAEGVVFYDPSDIRDTRVLPDTDFKEICEHDVKCNRATCKFAHPFVCPKGTSCTRTCKFLHPNSTSITPIGKEYPLNTKCKYNTACSIDKCKFAHPLGKMKVERKQVQVFITHSVTLQALPKPLAMKLEVPENAKYFQFQGEFVFFFVPYAGTWAKDHYQHVMMHRFDATTNAYKSVGTYNYDKHYCNSVVGCGQYLVISFWPYEDEAVRAVWEGVKSVRSVEKDMKKIVSKYKKMLKVKDAEITSLKEVIVKLDAKLVQANNQVQATNEELRQERMNSHSLRQAYESERNERLRARDPIHVFALQQNCSGFAQQDWKLVLDFHKGAHNLALHKSNNAGIQRLEVTEHDTVYHFDLNAPANVTSIANLPLVPERLCEDF